ncbi:MAG: hypothetical protein PHN88_14190 [Ignavibacteria bacterium]|nr:hypothetical protein [Ignavibacteria bacterium]
MCDKIKKEKFFELRLEGNNITRASEILDVPYITARRWNKELDALVKSENIKKSIESSILSALERFDNYSKLLSSEFGKLKKNSEKHKSVSLYFDTRMSYILKIMNMDKRLNQSMLNLLKLNKEISAPVKDSNIPDIPDDFIPESLEEENSPENADIQNSEESNIVPEKMSDNER